MPEMIRTLEVNSSFRSDPLLPMVGGGEGSGRQRRSHSTVGLGGRGPASAFMVSSNVVACQLSPPVLDLRAHISGPYDVLDAKPAACSRDHGETIDETSASPS